MSKKITIKIDENLHGRKIENILEKHLGFSSALAGRLKRTDGGIVLNGEGVKIITRVQAGDMLVLTLPDRESENIDAVNIPVKVLYEDEDILAVNKPRSMPVHPSRGHSRDTLANAVMYYLKGKSGGFHVITRLDKDTSGVVLLAKNPLAAQILTDGIKNREIEKEYIAAVNGVPSPETGTISAPIRKADNDGIRRIISPDGKEAVTKYEVIAAEEHLSLVKLCPVTGRTHQLRVHMSHIGTPIYGDNMYGAPQSGERTRLHCRSIGFEHPMTKEKVVIKAPVPGDIEALF